MQFQVSFLLSCLLAFFSSSSLYISMSMCSRLGGDFFSSAAVAAYGRSAGLQYGLQTLHYYRCVLYMYVYVDSGEHFLTARGGYGRVGR